MTGELLELKTLAEGTPVAIVGEQEAFRRVFGAVPRVGIFAGTAPHYKAGMLFVYFKSLRGNKIVGAPVALPAKAVPFKALGKVAAELVLAKEKRLRILNFPANFAGGSPILQCRLGSDPEIFVVDEKDEMIPAFTFLPPKGKARPANPRDGDSYGQKSAFWDGCQAEFITTSDTCLAYHVDSIQYGLTEVLAAARKKDKKAKLCLNPVLEVPPAVLQEESAEHLALGCDASNNIYKATGELVADPRQLPMRFAGGHIHLGTTEYHTNGDITKDSVLGEMVRSADILAAIPNVGIFADIDSPIRRKYYGLAGEFRLPPHGVEYRTLSNAWLTHPALTHLTFDSVRMAFRVGHRRLRDILFESVEDKQVQEIINNSDVKAARAFVKKHAPVYRAFFSYIYHPNTGEHTEVDQLTAVKYAMQAIEQGVGTIVKDPTDLAGNWGLIHGGWATHSGGAGCQWATACKDLSRGRLL